MYGWIETGGFFNQTIPEDIVFRTTNPAGKIAIGNANLSNLDAALYIHNNHIGVKCQASLQEVLSVNGDSVFHDSAIKITDTSNQARFDINGKGLRFFSTSNESIYADGIDSRLETESIVTKSVFMKKRTLQDVLVENATSIMIRETVEDTLIPGFDVLIDAQLAENFVDGTIIVVQKRSYYIWSSDIVSATQLSLKMSPYSTFAPRDQLVFATGDIITIDILEDWMPLNGASRLETLNYRFVIDNFAYEDVIAGATSDAVITNGLLDARFYFRNKRHLLRENLEIGSYFVVSNSAVITNLRPTIFLKLVAFERYTVANGQEGYHMRFRNADGVADLEAVRNVMESSFPGVAKTMYMFPMTFLSAPRVQDANATVGYVIDEFTGRLCYQLVNTNLAGLVSDYDRVRMLKSYAIDTIKLGARPLKHVKSAYKPFAPDTVVVDTYGVDDDIFTVSRQVVTYEFKGIPIRIEGYTRVSDVIASFEFKSEFRELVRNLKAYVGHFINWIDSKNPGGDAFALNSFETHDHETFTITVTATNDAIFDRVEFAMLDRIAYILPLKFTTHVRVGEENINTYAPFSMSIGTHVVRETLTVKGNTSVVGDLRVYNNRDTSLRENRFIMSYNDASVFDLNGCIQVSQSNVFMNRPLELNTTVTATDYLQYSDARLKKNVRFTDAKSDLERLSKVDVRLFNFYHCSRDSKGVIAQEIQDIFPEAVTSVKDILPLIEQIAYVCPKGYVRLHIADDSTPITPGTVLRFKISDTETLDSKVLHIEDVSFKHRPKGMDDIFKRTINAYISDYALIADKRFILVVGIVDQVLLVNYEVLYMSSINAIKELYKEIESLKKTRDQETYTP